MKIVIVIDRFGDVKNGAIQSTKRFVEYLRKENEVTVIAAGEEQAGMLKIQSFFIPFVKQKMVKNGIFFGWPKKEDLLQTLKDADVIHIQFPFYLGWKVAEWANELNKPLICSYHVQPENILLNLGINSRFLVEMLHRFFIRKFYSKADVVISPSDLGRRELLKNGLKAKCRVVSNGYVQEFKNNKAVNKIDFEGRFVILSVGRLSREKNQMVLVDAVKKSEYRDKIQLVIVGEGTEYDALKEKMNSLPHAILTGKIPQNELLSYYSSAQLFVHPSLVELESLVVLEAMAEGLPIIVSNSPCSAAKQFVNDSWRIFQYNDSTSLAEKIDYFISNRDELEKSARISQSLVKDYSIEESVSKILSIYRECAGKKSENDFKAEPVELAELARL